MDTIRRVGRERVYAEVLVHGLGVLGVGGVGIVWKLAGIAFVATLRAEVEAPGQTEGSFSCLKHGFNV